MKLKILLLLLILLSGKITIAQDSQKTTFQTDSAWSANQNFVKTSTGFSGGGATTEVVSLMRDNLPNNIQIKASGGIKTAEQAEAMIAAGATRLGCSNSVAIVTGK